VADQFFISGAFTVVNKRVAAELDDLSQAQRERLAYIEVKAFFCGDLTRADIERRFGIKPAASARDLSAYRRLAPDNLVYEVAQRRYAPTERFSPMFEHSAERVLTWFRSGFGDGLDLKLRRSVPCEGASDLVAPDLGTLATLTRAIASRRLVRVSYVSLSSGSSVKTLAPLALADTGMRWHLRAFDRDRGRFADFALTRIVKAKALDESIPDGEQIESDIQWSRIVHLELVPHPGLKHPKAVEADYRMAAGMLTLDMRAPLVGYALRRWSVDCSPEHKLDPNAHHLWLRNGATLYGVESATLAPGLGSTEGGQVGTV
jgi:hypothetical protein